MRQRTEQNRTELRQHLTMTSKKRSCKLAPTLANVQQVKKIVKERKKEKENEDNEIYLSKKSDQRNQ